MASKKRSVTPKKRTAVAKKARTEAVKTEVALVDVKSLALRPRKERTSALDPAIRSLLASPRSKAFVFSVPEGKDLRAQRTMLYPRIARILERLAPGKALRPSIVMLADGNLSVTLVDR